MYNGHLSIEEVDELSQQKGPAENQTHVENCQQCRLLLDKYKAVSAKLEKLMSARIGARNGMNCPDEKVWFDVAARNLPDTEGAKYVQHASECDSCGKKLATAMRLFQEDLTEEEEQALEELPGSTPEAQRKLAERLAGTSSKNARVVPDKPKGSFWKPFSFSLAGAAVALTSVLVFVSVGRHDSPADVEKLLAEAYTENRTVEMRVAGAAHSQLRQRRSGEATSLVAVPAAQRRAADQIAAALKKQPDDSGWLMRGAELDLLDWRYKPALAMLDEIGDNDSTQASLLRSLALYEQSEIENQREPMAQAANLLAKILQKEPDNNIALFNQAVVCERLQLYECAVSSWRRFLASERDDSWRKEALEHISRIEEKKTLE